MKSSIKFRNCLLTLSMLLVALTSYGAEGDATPLADPAARLQESAAFIGNLPSLSVAVVMQLKVINGEDADEGMTLKGTLGLSGKDSARFSVVTPDESMELYASDTGTFLYLTKENKYANSDRAISRQEALTALPTGPFQGAQMMLSEFLHGAPGLGDALKSATVTARDTVPIADTDQIYLESDGFKCDFWIQRGDKPFLLGLSLDLTEAAQQGNPELKEARVIYSLSDWNAAPEFPETHFAFEIPEGATKLTPPQQQPQGGPDPLVGTPAPDFDLISMDGGSAKLSTHKGKNVVILDFWASWCGPCRMGLPIVTRVAEQYKDKDVVLYAVNIGEDLPTVQAFLEQTKLGAPIAMDQKRVAQKLYQANSIPKTVIVGKDGMIREVHNGVSPTLESDLDELLKELTE